MTTRTKAFASMLAAGAAWAASVAMAQVTVYSPPANLNTAPGAVNNIQAGPVTVQTGPAGTNVTVPPGTAAAIGQRMAANAAERQAERQERITERQVARENWRMRNYNGLWWYWGPNNQWSVYLNNAWAPYTRAAHPGLMPPAVPTAPAVVGTAPPVASGPVVETYRRGLLGRRYSMGYRGVVVNPAPAAAPAPATTTAPAPAPSSPPTANP